MFTTEIVMNTLTKGRRKTAPRPHPADRPVRVTRNHPWMILQGLVETLDGYYTDSERSRIRDIVRRRDWDAYSDLCEDWGLQRISSNTPPSNVHKVRAKLAVATLLKKMESEEPDPSLDEVAFSNVIKGERSCREFNTRGRRRVADSDVTKLARKFIRRLIGDTVSESVFGQDCRHGPGVTTSNNFRNKDVLSKNSKLPYLVTTRSVPHARKLIASDQRWLDALDQSYRNNFDIPFYQPIDEEHFWAYVLKENDSNKIATVPKDRSKNRPIAIENNLNVMLQLGVDGFIRKRLRRMGINLNSQKKNQLLAREGSWRAGIYRPATVDLANASDTVSLGVCKLLLPVDWYNYLLDLRSTHGIFPDGTRIRYRKISSMGNGYTFAVESLIFAAIAYATAVIYFGYYPRRACSVYGDDIIVPELCVKECIRNLEAFGFSVNTEKSFLEGPVKESCGADWFCGRLVRTVYLKKRLTTLSDLYSARNRIIRFLTLYFPEVDTSKLDNLFIKWIGSGKMHLGPCSDTEFDTYWHTPVAPSWRNGCYRFVALRFYLPTKEVRNDSFNFLKLSARLLPKEDDRSCQWTKLLPSCGGSVFDVVNFTAIRSQEIRRSVPDWSDRYNLPMTEVRVSVPPLLAVVAWFPKSTPALSEGRCVLLRS